MFAGKHRPGAAASLREAADHAFDAPLALISDGQAAGEVVARRPGARRRGGLRRPPGARVARQRGMLEDAASTSSSLPPSSGWCSACGRARRDPLGQALGHDERREVRVPRGIVGMIEASATASPSCPSTRPSTSTTLPMAHVPVGWKKPRRLARTWVRAGTSRPAGARARRSRRAPGNEPPEPLEALGQHVLVAGVGEEAVVDQRRRGRVRRGEGHAAARARLHGEDGGARLPRLVRTRVNGGEQEQVEQVRVAQARGARHADLRHVDGVLGGERRELPLDGVPDREPEPDADVVEQPLPDREAARPRPDPAPQEDRGEP